jgi:ribonuclease D
MVVTPSLPVEIVASPAQLEKAVKEMLNSRCIALDTESNSFHHYPEQLCLVQVATERKVYLIDTITLKQPEALQAVLAEASIQKVLHGADYDIRSLDRHCGLRVCNLFDTNIAARFAGLARVGLSALTEDLMGLNIPKSKRLQRADWGLRPLSAEALDYAASDVRHLFTLKDLLEQRLLTLGRTDWAAEEYARLEKVRFVPPIMENAFLSVKGVNTLDERGLAIMRSLFLFRDEEARRLRRPPFFVLQDETLVFLSASPEVSLSQVPGLGRTGLQRFGQGLSRAISEGIKAPPVHRPNVNSERPGREQLVRLTQLKAWRSKLGTSLALDPALLWPTVSLERLAKAPDTFETELSSPDIRRWQLKHFAASLRTVIKTWQR